MIGTPRRIRVKVIDQRKARATIRWQGLTSGIRIYCEEGRLRIERIDDSFDYQAPRLQIES